MRIKHPIAIVVSLTLAIAALFFLIFSQYLAEKAKPVSSEKKINRPNYYFNAESPEEPSAKSSPATDTILQRNDIPSETTD